VPTDTRILESALLVVRWQRGERDAFDSLVRLWERPLQLLKGMHAPADPASTFGVLLVFTFAAVCTSWSIANRIAAAELSAREQALRLECRLADLAQRLPKYPSPP
jgi:hypothetical protein